jgi:hypothetical protein
MKHSIWIFFILLLFNACTGTTEEDSSTTTEDLKHNTNFTHSAKTVTIYVPDYEKSGYALNGVYGQSFESDFLDTLVEFTNLPTLENYNKETFSNLITAVEYYGDEAPFYYTFLDTTDLSRVTEEYGGGIPRYAMIVAKFATYILEETEADKINIISHGMGSLITRWMIEKNIEQLASSKKIEKWMSIDGMIRGNYLLSRATELNNISINSYIQPFFENSVDTQQMQYTWIEENLTPDRERMGSSYYDDILVGQISLTESDGADVGLSYVLSVDGQFQAHNGYQLVKDTYFGTIDYSIQTPSQTYIHKDYANVDESNGIFATLNSFLEAKKRVRVTLVDVTVTDMHETISSDNEASEIVFENSIFSPYAESQWDMEDEAISEKLYESGMLTLHDYQENGETKELNQILFDDFVSSSETTLNLEIEGYEIDRNTKYNLNEEGITTKDSLGKTTNSIELSNGATYSISADDWNASLKVEVVEM